jgi:hypothetical protein
LIQGQLSEVTPPDFKDNYGNSYQNITVNTQSGPIQGRKASKQPYGIHDVGREVKWECEAASNSRGPYNKFKTPPDPRYQQQAPQAATGQGSPPQNPRRSNAPQCEDVPGKVRHGVVCAYLSAGVEPTIEQAEYWKEYIMTGQAPLPPGQGDDVPY